MIITLNIELDKSKIENFDELNTTVWKTVLEAGKEIVVQVLGEWDEEIRKTRDKKRFRCKGKRKTCVKTRLGAIEYERNVYIDRADPEHKQCVYLLDEEKAVRLFGCAAADICEMATQSIVNNTYRGTAQEITERTGSSISAQGVWDIVQKVGENRRQQVERYAQQAQQNQSIGVVESKIVYEENDGIWLKLQGKSREKYGTTKEMKMGIAYDGATWKIEKNNQKRRTLDNKVAYAAFEDITTFKKNKEGVLASRFNVDEIELRVINGDGAQWIQKRSDVECISVLDKFHRNKKITECVQNKEHAKLIRELLYKGQVQDVMDYLEALVNSAEDPIEKAKLRELFTYYKNNRDSLTDYYSRGIEIPPTRTPGIVHHARLGSMESNVFTLIGNRMKNRRFAWSINGANNLASILCAYHTMGTRGLLEISQALPVGNEPTTVSALSVAQTQKKVGKGYEPEHAASLPRIHWLKQITSCKPLCEI